MTEYAAVANRERCPAHPGEVLADIVADIPELSNKTVLAGRLRISRNHLHAILSGRKPISPAMAAKLGKFFGNGPGLWLRLQAGHDAWHAEREIDVSDIETFKAA